MNSNLAYISNFKKKNENFVSYVITLFNKEEFAKSVIRALQNEGGSHEREYIFVDDGSTDETFKKFKKLCKNLPGKSQIYTRMNLGASYSTNEAVKKTKGYWIRLLDGDDLIVKKSTANMLKIARLSKTEFVYGDIDDRNVCRKKKLAYSLQSKEEGLKKFIKNCPANSSSILVSKKRFFSSGGCNESFVSPDQVLFLRLFKSGDGTYYNSLVAKTPSKKLKNRLSSQVKRSRYESILALIDFCEQGPELANNLKKKAYKRALSRAFNYYRYFNRSVYSIHLVRYLISKLYFPKDYLKNMYASLGVFTNNKNNKPKKWMTGSDIKAISKRIIE